MVNADHTVDEIAEELDVTPGYIYKIKRELGMTKKRRSPKDDAQTIVEMFKQGHDKAEIADKLGWAKGTINSILRENGFGKPAPEELAEPPLIVPKRKVITLELVIHNGTRYHDILPLIFREG